MHYQGCKHYNTKKNNRINDEYTVLDPWNVFFKIDFESDFSKLHRQQFQWIFRVSMRVKGKSLEKHT